MSVVGSISWLTASQVASRLIRLAIAVLATGSLGVKEWGEFCFALAFSSWCSLVADLGLHNLLVRELSQKPEDSDAIFGSVLGVRILILIPMMIITGVAYCWIKQFDAVFALLILLNLLVTFSDSLKDLFSAALRSFNGFYHEAIVTLISQIALLVLSFLVLATEHTTALYLTGAYLLASLLQLLGYAICSLRVSISRIRLGLRFKNFSLLTLAKEAVSSSILQITLTTVVICQTTLLGLLHSPDSSGFFTAGWRFLDILLVPPGIILVALTPHIHRSAAKEVNLAGLIHSATLLLLFLGLPIVWLGGVFAGDLVALLYGQDFAPIVWPTRLLIFSVLLTAPILLMQLITFSKRKHTASPRLFSILVVVDALATISLGSVFGVFGGALAATITFAILAFTLFKPFFNREWFVMSEEFRALLFSAGSLALGTMLGFWLHHRLFFFLGAALVYVCISYQNILRLVSFIRAEIYSCPSANGSQTKI